MGDPQQQIAFAGKTHAFLPEVALQAHQSQDQKGCKDRPLPKDHPTFTGAACARQEVGPPAELQKHIRAEHAHEPNASNSWGYRCPERSLEPSSSHGVKGKM